MEGARLLCGTGVARDGESVGRGPVVAWGWRVGPVQHDLAGIVSRRGLRKTGGREGARSDGSSLGVVPSDQATATGASSTSFSLSLLGGSSLPTWHCHRRSPPPLLKQQRSLGRLVVDSPPRAAGPRNGARDCALSPPPPRPSLEEGHTGGGGGGVQGGGGLAPAGRGLPKWVRLLQEPGLVASSAPAPTAVCVGGTCAGAVHLVDGLSSPHPPNPCPHTHPLSTPSPPTTVMDSHCRAPRRLPEEPFRRVNHSKDSR